MRRRWTLGVLGFVLLAAGPGVGLATGSLAADLALVVLGAIALLAVVPWTR